MKLSVIIVSYNVKYLLWQSLRSLFRALDGIESEVFVVDNNSEDGTVEYLKEKFPEHAYPTLKILANKENLGFGKANNLAFRQSRGEYILFLNPDTIVCEDTIEECLTFASSKEYFGGLGVKMLHDNGTFAKESCRGIPTPWTAFCKLSRLSSIFPKSKYFSRYYMGYLDLSQPAEIEIISGAFMFASAKALRQVEPFDERFFMYGEDIDLSYRLLQGGYKNYYLPIPIIHYKGESTRKNSFGHVKTFYQAMSLFYKKHNEGSYLKIAVVDFSVYVCTAISMLSKLLRRAIATCLKRPNSNESSTQSLQVYNSETQTYKEIISSIENSSHKNYLAIKYPQEHIIITSGKPIKI